VSRRQFLKGSGVAAATTALAQAPVRALAGHAVEESAAEGAPGMGPGAVKLTLNVNGSDMTTWVEPRTTLLDTLRNHLDVTGCKRVCDRGTCGACTVMVEGMPIYSCTMLALEAQGKKIKTAEALISGDKLDAVPAAFVKYDAQQCGFCTPGFVVAMRAVLRHLSADARRHRGALRQAPGERGRERGLSHGKLAQGTPTDRQKAFANRRPGQEHRDRQIQL
jgi:xanthine dehydrogenase YagT iron-sulfur-binding subunit